MNSTPANQSETSQQSETYNQHPTTNNPTLPPFPNSKLPFIVAGIITVSLVGIGAYFLGKSQNKSTPSNNSSSPTSSLYPEPSRRATPDPTAIWKTYSDANISLKYPSNWNASPLQISGSGSTLEIKDSLNIYSFIFRTEGNYNQETGKKYKDIYEYLKIPYELKTIMVEGQKAVQGLPRAGSESDYAIFFFSKDSQFIYTIELDTPRDGSKIDEGQKLFDQILSTFKFLDQTQTATGQCIPTFKVETGPELTSSQAYAQKCYEKKTQIECNKVDIYRAATNNFGNPDGIPDCRWTGSPH